MSSLSIRSADIADAGAIAAFHVKVWRHTYRGLAPAEAYARLDEKQRRERWRHKLAAPGGDQIVLVAETGSGIVGLGAAGMASHPIFAERGEIGSLYVDPDFKRRGIGRMLIARLARHLREKGYAGAALGVVKGNDPAIAFYKALGGRLIGEFVDPGPVWPSENLAYAWDDLSALTD